MKLKYVNKTFKKKECLEFSKHDLKWTDRDLNPGPPPCQGDDLPSGLPAQNQIKICIIIFTSFSLITISILYHKKFKNYDNLKIF